MKDISLWHNHIVSFLCHMCSFLRIASHSWNPEGPCNSILHFLMDSRHFPGLFISLLTENDCRRVIEREQTSMSFFISKEHCNVNKWLIKAGSLFREPFFQVLFTCRLCWGGNTCVRDNCVWKKSNAFLYKGKALNMYTWKKSETVAVGGKLESNTVSHIGNHLCDLRVVLPSNMACRDNTKHATSALRGKRQGPQMESDAACVNRKLHRK